MTLIHIQVGLRIPAAFCGLCKWLRIVQFRVCGLKTPVIIQGILATEENETFSVDLFLGHVIILL